MIESIRIENLGVIESAELTLSPGLTALTGETGAGKTMVLTSLGLLLGQRAEPRIVRAGCERTSVEGSFVLPEDSRPAERAIEAGAAMEEDLLLVSRVVPAQGRSRAYLGGRSVPSSVLSEVGQDLVAVHGQADQLRLRSASAQRQALDSFGGREHLQVCRDYAQAYRRLQAARAELEEWRSGAASRAAEIALLRSWLEVIEELSPQPGEDEQLAAEAQRLDHAEDLRLGAGNAQSALAGDEEALSDSPQVLGLLAETERALETVRDVDPHLAAILERVASLRIEATDISAELSDYLANLDADPQRLAWVQGRRAELRRAFQEVGVGQAVITSADELLAFGQTSAERLAQLEGPADGAGPLEEAVVEAAEALNSLACQLTAARQELATRLEAAVASELEGLHMRGARLVVGLEELSEPGPTGAESVSLLLASHPGAEPLPLGKGASGGELSRIMLALEVVLVEAETDTASRLRRTLVFDEIDAGVGGKAAGEIGRRLKRLAQHHQVIVVTHLPQVAAWADRQLVVAKTVREGEEGLTATTVTEVRAGDRERELARMLSGHDTSDVALRHAAELLREAAHAQGVAQSSV